MRYALLILALLWTAHAWAVTHPSEKLADPALEARAMALTQQLRCVVCQNESIEASHADIARDIRVLVRKKIAEGQTDEAVIDFLRARYGDYILLNPPLSRHTYLLWLAPLIILAMGTMMSMPYLARRKRK